MARRAAVCVIGGGPTGLAAAWELAVGGARVVVCEAGTIGAGAAARAPGLALPDLLDCWGRIARALPADTCRGLRDFAATGPAWLRDRLGTAAGTDTDVWHLPAGQVEWDDLGRTAELLATWGVEHQRLYGVLLVPGILRCAPGPLARALADGARSAGAEIREGTTVRAVRPADGGGVAVETADGTVTAEVALVTCEGAAPGLVPSLRGVLTPWRGQGCVADRGAGPGPIVCNAGHEMYVPLPGGGVACAGLNPEPGPDDFTTDPTPTAPFQSHVQAAFARRFPAAGAAFAEAWAAPTAWTPDGLPLVGALPGQPRILVAAGFHARALAWGTAAAIALARAILGVAGATPIPPALAPRRLLGG